MALALYRAAPSAKTEAKKLARWALTSLGKTRIESAIALARSDERIRVSADDLDADPWLLNCSNGSLCLKTGTLRPHRERDLLTQLVPVAYKTDASAPRWERFLCEVFKKNSDLVDFVQRAVGLSLTGRVLEHVLLFLHGTGRNGKSVFLKTIQTALGPDYAQSLRPEVLVHAHGTGAHSSEIARLRGARFVATSEPDPGRRLAESTVKLLTGGDRLVARRLYQEPFEFSPSATFFMAANHKPSIRGTDEGIWRRIMMIPFHFRITEAQEDKQLDKRLADELPGILAWAVRGCLDYQRFGLKPPSAVVEATTEYKDEMDILAPFLDDCCYRVPGERTSASELYREYQSWASKAGIQRPMRQRSFGMALTERDFRRRKINGRVYYEGLTLTNPAWEGRNPL